MLLVALVLCLLLLSSSIATGKQCSDDNTSNPAEPHDGYTLSVSAVFKDNNRLSLICSLINATLLSGQELIWTEGNTEVNYSNVNKVVTSTSSILNIDNITEVHYGIYTCQCYNRQNYTLNELHKLIETKSYVHHCSENISVTAIPIASNITTSRHYVDTPGDNVTITCVSTLNKVLSNTTELVPVVGGVITVSSPNDQGKFLCVSENTVMEIHYVSIKDYEPIEFILPNGTSITIRIPFNVNSNTPPPLCAVYSSLSLDEFFLEFYTGGSFIGRLKSTYHWRAPIGENLSTLQLIPNTGSHFIESFVFVCKAKTIWEEKSYSYRVKFDRGAPELVPSLCVTASITPSISPVISGSTVTLTCLVHSDIGLLKTNVIIIHEMTNGTIRELQPQEDSTLNLFQSDLYILTLHDISITEDDGEYICRAVITEFNIEVEESVILNITEKVNNEISTTPPIFFPIASSTSTENYKLTTPTSSSLTTSISIHTTTSPSHFTQNINIIFIVSSVGTFVIVLIVASSTILCILMVIKTRGTRTHPQMGNPPVQVSMSHQKIPLSDLGFKQHELGFDSISISISTSSGLIHQLQPDVTSRLMTACIQELHNSPWYVPYDKLVFKEDLGSGAFGTVRKAEVYNLTEECKIVAVKMLKEMPSEDDIRDIVTEFHVLQHVGAHNNIVALIGASDFKGQLMLIVEYCAGGNLLHYLRNKRQDLDSPLTVPLEMDMALQVSRGMSYLASQKCVHRDLAARNILLDKNNTLKVADFGLARETYHSVYKKTSKGKIPFKWMSPESIFDKIYTTKSDVWSFGVLLMEIVTLGQSPYPGKTVDQVIEQLRDQKIMKRPRRCAPKVYEIMRKCWQFDPKQRPNFNDLVNILEEFLANYNEREPGYNIPERCTCADEGVCCCFNETVSPLPPEALNESSTQSGIDSGHQEHPSYREILSSIEAKNPNLIPSVNGLCTKCQKNYLHYYYYTFMCNDTENSNSNGIDCHITQNSLNSSDISAISLCEECRDLPSMKGSHLQPLKDSTTKLIKPVFKMDYRERLASDNKDSGMMRDFISPDIPHHRRHNYTSFTPQCQMIWSSSGEHSTTDYIRTTIQGGDVGYRSGMLGTLL